MKNSLNHNQSGIVSIIVTVIIMMVISLIVAGFAVNTRREQRQALDRQLNTQAFYAAETGINDAIKAIKANPALPDKTDCGPLPGFSQTVGAATDNVSYSCLLITHTLDNLQYNPVLRDKSQLIPINAVSTINDLTIGWEDASMPPLPHTPSTASCPSTGNFPAVGAWPSPNCDAGVLRVDLVPTSGTLSRSGLRSGAFTVFLYPQTGGGSIAYGSANSGQYVAGNCGAAGNPKLCAVTINGLSQNNYYMRVRSIYQDSAVSVAANGGSLALQGAQVLIDATGKANDILRRVQVRLPVDVIGEAFPEAAIQSYNSICKRLAITPNTAVTDVAPTTDPNNPCTPL